MSNSQSRTTDIVSVMANDRSDCSVGLKDGEHSSNFEPSKQSQTTTVTKWSEQC